MLKKTLSVLIIVLVFAATLCSCSGEAEQSVPSEPEEYSLALIAERGKMKDNGYNELSMLGIERIAKVRNLTYKYYPSSEATDESRLAAIDLAVKNGAEVIVTPSYHFETSVYTAQTKYPDVKFIIIDGAPHPAGEYVSAESDIAENTASIFFSEEQVGYLAGYAAVKNGSTHLGFMGGMPIEAVRAYGNGFLQGAEAAAAEEELADGSVTVNYRYTGDFENSDANTKAAEAMYKSGADTVFACNTTVLKATCTAAEANNGKVIAAEFDGSERSETVIASAVKELEYTVYRIINSAYNNTFSFYGGKSTRLGANLHAIAFIENTEFKDFTTDEYNALYYDLLTGVRVPVRDFEISSIDYIATAEEMTANLALKKVTVIIEK